MLCNGRNNVASNGGGLVLLDTNSCGGVEIYNEQYALEPQVAFDSLMSMNMALASPSNINNTASRLRSQPIDRAILRASPSSDDQQYYDGHSTALVDATPGRVQFSNTIFRANLATTAGGAIMRRVGGYLQYNPNPTSPRRVPFEFVGVNKLIGNSALYGGALFVTTEAGLLDAVCSSVIDVFHRLLVAFAGWY
jgi:hypothetical protein